MDPAIPFADDDQHAAYDPHAAQLFWRQLMQANRVLTMFRSGFIGKVSPVHFFWGGMDLACTRFSGRPAPPHPGGAPNCPSWVMREGYSHELASCGFWPGGGEEGAFYAYAYPEPPGYADVSVRPADTRYEAGEYLLPYETVASATRPRPRAHRVPRHDLRSCGRPGSLGPRRARSRPDRSVKPRWVRHLEYLPRTVFAWSWSGWSATPRRQSVRT